MNVPPTLGYDCPPGQSPERTQMLLSLLLSVATDKDGSCEQSRVCNFLYSSPSCERNPHGMD